MSKTVSDLVRIFKSSVSAVLPDNLIQNFLRYNAATQTLLVQNDTYDLRNKDVYLVGTGKAVLKMGIETQKLMGSKLKKGIVSIPIGSYSEVMCSDNVQYFEGAENNLPDLAAESTTKKIIDLVLKLEKSDLLLVLISGGGSALLPLPIDPISLDEKTTLIKNLALAGADIKELNTVRKKLSDTKGGKLALTAQPAQVVSLILSDIVGDPIDLIASGPTTENKDSPTKAIEIIQKYKLIDVLPYSIKTVLTKCERLQEFPNNVKNYIIGSNNISINAAMKEAERLQFRPIKLSNEVTGNVKDIANEYVKLTRIFCQFLSRSLTIDEANSQMKTLNIPGLFCDLKTLDLDSNSICLILGGEITVQVTGQGKGGRNQHLSLEYSRTLDSVKDELRDFDIYILSAGTDGIDGPTDAAGAIGYKDLVLDAKEENLDVCRYIRENNSYNFYRKFKNGKFHILIGHTGTNVMDIHLIIIMKKK